MVQEGLEVKLAIFNNGYLGMVRQWQQFFHGGRYSNTPIWSPDYVKLAQAYGIPAWRVKEPGELMPAIGAAMAYPGPAIIEFQVARHEDVYPWVLGGTALGDVLPDTPYQADTQTRRDGDAEKETVPASPRSRVPASRSDAGGA
jgi:acetolactate synthase-1/2/3 large subunit